MKPFYRNIVTIGIFLTVMLAIVGTVSAYGWSTNDTLIGEPSPTGSAYLSTVDVVSGSTDATFVSEVNEPVAEGTEIQPYYYTDSMFNIGENLNSIVNASEVDGDNITYTASDLPSV